MVDIDSAPQTAITAFWDGRGENYDSRPRHGLQYPEERAAWLKLLRDLLPPPPASVLDVGTGTGFLAHLLAELGYQVTGIDLSQGMLNAAKQKAVPSGTAPVFTLGDAITPPFPPASFDVITNRWVLWTLVDPELAFGNWFTLLCPGGRAIVIDSLHSAPSDRPAWSPYPAEVTGALSMRGLNSPEQPIALARRSGFEQIQAFMLNDINSLEQRLHPDSGAESNVRYALLMEKP